MAYGQASIQALLGGLLKNRRMLGSLRRVMIMSLWEQVVGKVVAQKSWPEKVADGVLYIGVSSHPWAAELLLLKPQILTRYRQLLGRSALKDLDFRVARRRAHKEEESEQRVILHPPPHETLRPQPLPGQLLADIQNPEVRDLLGPLFAKLRAERQWKHEHGWAHCIACRRVIHGTVCPHCGGCPVEE